MNTEQEYYRTPLISYIPPEDNIEDENEKEYKYFPTRAIVFYRHTPTQEENDETGYTSSPEF